MKDVKIIVNKAFTKGKIDKRIYGSFLEHLGRTIYSGIYEPENPCADENGFRTDVLKAVKDLGVTNIRYPGGNFISNYDWRDSVGPKEKRPKKLEIAWRVTETNEFGINEFMMWAQKANIEPIFTVNLGTKGVEDATAFVEYCNHSKGTTYSNLRIEHGFEKPYKIKTWCLGNEMDGDWQIGHKTAEEYGRIAHETAKAMKRVDPDIELVSCGSSLSTMESYPQWDATTLNHTYDLVDYVSLHQYYAGQDKGIYAFLAQSLDMERYIKSTAATCDYIKAKLRSDKTLNISFDEWGVWSKIPQDVTDSIEKNPWQVAPPFGEAIYSFQDSLLFSSMLMALMKNADRVKIACQSLLTNVSATIMTERGGGIWLQPIYYPFAHAANYGQGQVLDAIIDCPTYACEQFDNVPWLDTVIVYNDEAGEIVLFALNRSTDEALHVNCELQGFHAKEIIEHLTMECDDVNATNEFDHHRIEPHKNGKSVIKDGQLYAEINRLSWNVIRVKVEQ